MLLFICEKQYDYQIYYLIEILLETNVISI